MIESITSKTTPGPWRIGAYESGRMAVDGANGEEVTGWIAPEDAILIASAPDMLTFIKEVAKTDSEMSAKAIEIIKRATAQVNEKSLEEQI